MLVVAIVCALSAIGLARRTRWGHRFAVTAIAVNLLGDLLNAVVLGDPHLDWHSHWRSSHLVSDEFPHTSTV